MAAEIVLPYRTDWREMSSVLDYCKGKGADRGALEARFGAGESLRETLNALDQLGLIERAESGDARLTVAGEQLAYAPDAQRARARLVEAMLSYPPYRFPLERAVADGATLLDGPWVEHIWQVDMRLGQPRNRVEEARTFFFRLAAEAGLGVYRRGVRGQTTRLELADDFTARLRPLLQRERDASSEQVEPSGAGAASGLPGATTRETTRADRQPTVMPQPLATSSGSAPPAPAQSASSGVAARGVEAPFAMLPVERAGLSIQVDMSDWELDKIEAFLKMIGYLPTDG